MLKMTQVIKYGSENGEKTYFLRVQGCPERKNINCDVTYQNQDFVEDISC